MSNHKQESFGRSGFKVQARVLKHDQHLGEL